MAKKIAIIFEVDDVVTPDQLHELVCKAVYEGRMVNPGDKNEAIIDVQNIDEIACEEKVGLVNTLTEQIVKECHCGDPDCFTCNCGAALGNDEMPKLKYVDMAFAIGYKKGEENYLRRVK